MSPPSAHTTGIFVFSSNATRQAAREEGERQNIRWNMEGTGDRQVVPLEAILYQRCAMSGSWISALRVKAMLCLEPISSLNPI